MGISPQALPPQLFRHKGPRYTPIAKRQDKPDAIAFLLKTYPELTEAQISKLIGTTKPTIAAIRDRTHWNSSNIKPRHPVELGLCTYEELEGALTRSRSDNPPSGPTRSSNGARGALRRASGSAPGISIQRGRSDVAAIQLWKPSVGRTSGTRLRPLCFARYKAWSARSMVSSPSS